MRNFRIGSPASSSWSPEFKVSNEHKPSRDKLGARKTQVLCWFPTVKGPLRQETLRHYFHKNMAKLLDARPEVTSWTTQTPPLKLELYGRPVEFTPDFVVVENGWTRAIRLLRAGTTLAEKRQERHAAVADAYRDAGQHFDVITEEQLLADVRLPAAVELFINRLRDWPDEMPGELADAWGDAAPVALGEVHRSIGGDVLSWHQLLGLAALGHLHLDLGAGLTVDTAVLGFDAVGYRQ